MTRQITKATKNVYCKARIEAAKYNSKFASRESASEELGWSKDSLAQYELGLCKVVPVDKVVIMADAYNAPELLNNYCCNECPIGKRIIEPIDKENIDNLFRFAVLTSNTLDESPIIQKALLKIVEDGVIDESEREELAAIVDFFSKLEMRASELKVYAKKLML